MCTLCVLRRALSGMAFPATRYFSVPFFPSPIASMFACGGARSAQMSAHELLQRMKKDGAAQKDDGKPNKEERRFDPARELAQKFLRQTTWFRGCHPNTVTKVLKESVIYHRDDVMVVNKPYGLPVYGDPEGAQNSISSVLSRLHIMMGLIPRRPQRNTKMVFTSNSKVVEPPVNMVGKVYLPCHRLDRDTTGVLLLARGEVRSRIGEAWRSREVSHLYLAVTLGVPANSRGTIDMPLRVKTLLGKQRGQRMEPAVPFHVDTHRAVLVKGRLPLNAKRAVTHYEVLCSSKHAALVALRPKTGVKHQLRAHLAYGLKTPVLGDHKYSTPRNSPTGLKPQKVPPTLLKTLGLLPRDRKRSRNKWITGRRLPFHLHALTLTLPGLGPDGALLSVSAPVPPLFRRTLRHLDLEIPSHLTPGAPAIVDST